MPTGDVGMYVSDMDLVSGTILPPTKVSVQPINTINAQLTCQDVIPMRANASVGASGTSYQVAWRQLNTAGTGCDLVVNGQKINTASHVVTFAVSGRNGDINAVWMERDVAVPITERVYWSRRDPATGNWSTPAPLSTQIPLTSNQQMIAGAAGPSGTLAIAWQALGTDGGNLLSKHVAGTWTTVTAPPVSDIRALAINAVGQGAAVYRSASCGSSMCEELSVYQF